jgi:hypothetical protein
MEPSSEDENASLGEYLLRGSEGSSSGAGTNPVSTYLDALTSALSATSEQPLPPMVAVSALTPGEKAVLKQLLGSSTESMKTSDLVAGTGLGTMELSGAVHQLQDRGFLEVRGDGADEEVALI